MKYITITFLILALTVMPAHALAHSPMMWDFERGDTRGWDIPDWAFDQGDHVAKHVEVSDEQASKGAHALKVLCDFPGDYWTAALIEYSQDNDMDFTGYKTISVDIFIPKSVNTELLQARIIITAGLWWFIETRSAVKLKQGEWTTVTATLKTEMDDTGQLSYWKCRTRGVKLSENLDKVKKVAVRIEYNANPSQAGPQYNGPIYIDNISIK